MELPKKYSFSQIEEKWKTYWNEKNVYISDFHVEKGRKIFSVDTPPPTVSGQMHMGHAFSYAQGDFIVRYHRMKGDKIFYPFGTDDNGLPTEHLVERLKKVNSRSMTRPEFVALCHKTINEIKPAFVQPWIDLGISVDYNHSYSTIDARATRISQQSFLDLYNKKLVYKKETPTTWCVTCQTAIAQADFENVEKKSFFNDISFHDEEGNELLISTTRPELLPACVGLFAHPDDERYKHLKGKKAIVPLFNYTVPILFDENVALDKGTGLMMVCTFGDKEDVEKWHKYKLELRTVINKDGTLNELAKPYDTLSIKEAREKIIQDLRASGDLKSQQKITHNANTHDRCGTEIEFMKTSQWFINVMNHKEKLISLADEITWHPAHMKTRYVNWVKNLNWDWCISRQRHFGVPFPVWYEKDTGNIIVADTDDLPIDPTTAIPKKYTKEKTNLIPESDVLDTWATSSVTPQIALDWGKTDEKEFSSALPMTLRMQSHDIIRTWAFYTIVKAWYNNKTIPWKNIMISGFVLDKNGKKMSKSKGNTIDPTKIINLFGADVVRYAASAVKLGEDLPFQDKYLETGKKVVTKLFNAAKFAHLHLEDYKGEKLAINKITTIDKWLISKLNKTIKDVTTFLESFEFAKARALIEQFFWEDFCDNYLEIVKDRLYNPDKYGTDARYAGQMTLYHTLLTIIKLFAPYLPYITEEIFSWKFANDLDAKSIHTEGWPTFNKDLVFSNEEQSGEIAKQFIALGRQQKNQNGVSQKHEFISATLKGPAKIITPVQKDIMMTLHCKEITIVDSEKIAFNGILAPKEEKQKN